MVNVDGNSPGGMRTKHECMACGYIYDPIIGDPDSGIPAGTSFEDLPDEWLCPLCGVEKKYFLEKCA